MHLLDRVPSSGIVRIRDLMYGVENPFRLDQGDVSFDAPDTVKAAMARAIVENRSHYLPTTGVPRLRELIAEKLRRQNRVPVASDDEVFVTQGGIHGLYVICQSLLEPGDEVVVPDPAWPPVQTNVMAARGVPVPCALHESLGWHYDVDELARCITEKTRAIYVNTPHNPTGGVLGLHDLEAVATLADRHGLWVIADEAYEDVVYDGAAHVSLGSLEGMYPRTLGVYTFSKTYAMTGLRLGYVTVQDPALRERARKALFMTVSNVASVVQYGGIGALEGSQDAVTAFREELQARRDLFYDAMGGLPGAPFAGEAPRGAFYAFLRISPEWQPRPDAHPNGIPASRSWAMVEELIGRARVGCVPGVDFGAHGEEHVRFCFARERSEIAGAVESMRAMFGS